MSYSERFSGRQFSFPIEPKYIKELYRSCYKIQMYLICDYHLEFGKVTRVDITITTSFATMVDFTDELQSEIEAAAKSNAEQYLEDKKLVA